MNYAAIKPCDIANGPGVRVSLFVSGCTHHCPGCFQPETWDFNYGERFTDREIWRILHLLEPSYISGLTILGGEPLEPQNMVGVFTLTDMVRRVFPRKIFAKEQEVTEMEPTLSSIIWIFWWMGLLLRLRKTSVWCSVVQVISASLICRGQKWPEKSYFGRMINETADNQYRGLSHSRDLLRYQLFSR